MFTKPPVAKVESIICLKSIFYHCFLLIVFFFALFKFTSVINANPSGAQVVSGQITISNPNAHQLLINQSTQKGIINWQSFNINANQHTHFQQPNAQAITLNRVIGGGGASQILGRLSANGQIMLINPAGIVFGPNSRVDVAGLIASTAEIKNEDFLNNRFYFEQPYPQFGEIINQGNITIAGGGLAALVAPSVENHGVISARMGKVLLASGHAYTIDPYGDGLIEFAVGESAHSHYVSNSGRIEADGGTVLMTTGAVADTLNNVINMSGVIEANSISEHKGVITLHAHGKGGTINVSGQIIAKGDDAGEQGGLINIIGEEVNLLNGAVFDARSYLKGGEIYINAEKLVDGYGPLGERTLVEHGVNFDVSGMGYGDAGEVVIWAADVLDFGGDVYARGGDLGGDGGFIETSGATVNFLEGIMPKFDTIALLGKSGLWLLDPAVIVIDAVYAATIENTLGLGTSVRIATTGGNGDSLTMTAPINQPYTVGTPTLTLEANKLLELSQDISGDFNVYISKVGDPSNPGGIDRRFGGVHRLFANIDLQDDGDGTTPSLTVKTNGHNFDQLHIDADKIFPDNSTFIITGSSSTLDLSSTSRALNYVFNSPTQFTIDGKWSFTARNTVSGSGNDYVTMNTASKSGSFNAGGGYNVLDFSSVTTPLYVRLGVPSRGQYNNFDRAIGGQSDEDRLRGEHPQQDTSTWRITSIYAGTIDTVAWEGFERLEAASNCSSCSRMTERFYVEPAGYVKSIDAGRSYHNFYACCGRFLYGPNTDNTWTITGADSGTLRVGGQSRDIAFTGFDTDKEAFGPNNGIYGGTGVDTFYLSPTVNYINKIFGGGGQDVLVGADINNVWNMQGNGRGNVNGGNRYESIERFVGGSADDTFRFTNASASNFISIDGEDYNDFNTVDFSSVNSSVNLILPRTTNINRIIGGPADDTVTATSGDDVWTINADGVSVNGQTWVGFENYDGAGGNDTFNFYGTTIEGGTFLGGTGTDVFNYVNYTNPVNINLQTNAATGTGGFDSIEQVVGNGQGTITGNNSGTRFNINGSDDGTVQYANTLLTFTDVPNLAGGSGVDQFVFDENQSVSGTLTGNGGVDILNYQAYSDQVTVDFGNNTATGTSGINFDSASVLGGTNANDRLVGTSGDDNFNVTGSGDIDGTYFWDDAIDIIDGGAGTDTLNGPATVDTNWTVDSDNGGRLSYDFGDGAESVSFVSMENLTGGSGADTFIFELGAEVDGVVNGGAPAADNTLDYSNWGGGAVTITYTTAISGTATNIHGGFQNFLDIVGDNSSITLGGANIANTWAITGDNDGTLNGSISFTDIVSLVGGTDTDVFDFSDGASISGLVDGGTGADINTLDYADYNADVTIDLANNTATATGGIKNISVLVGGGGDDTLVGRNLDSNWDITADNAGTIVDDSATFPDFAFNNIENLIGGSGNDTFLFQDTLGVSGAIDGGAGDDTLDYTPWATAPTVDQTAETAPNISNGFSNIENFVNTASPAVGGGLPGAVDGATDPPVASPPALPDADVAVEGGDSGAGGSGGDAGGSGDAGAGGGSGDAGAGGGSGDGGSGGVTGASGDGGSAGASGDGGAAGASGGSGAGADGGDVASPDSGVGADAGMIASTILPMMSIAPELLASEPGSAPSVLGSTGTVVMAAAGATVLLGGIGMAAVGVGSGTIVGTAVSAGVGMNTTATGTVTSVAAAASIAGMQFGAGGDLYSDDDSTSLLYSMLGNFYHLDREEHFTVTITDIVEHGSVVHLIADVDNTVRDTDTHEHKLIPKHSKLIGMYECDEDELTIVWHHIHRPEQGEFDKEQWLQDVISIPNLLDNDIINQHMNGQPIYLKSAVFQSELPLAYSDTHQAFHHRLLGVRLAVNVEHDMFFSKDMVEKGLDPDYKEVPHRI